MKLTELGPRLSPPGGAYQTLIFMCPLCRKHEISIDIWNGKAGDLEVPMSGLPPDQPMRVVKRLWHAEQTDNSFYTMSVTPSINRAGLDGKYGCAGWHGHITNGEIA